MLTHGMRAVPASALSGPLVLAIDLGASAVKTALVSADGSVSAGARRVLHGASPAGWRRSAYTAPSVSATYYRALVASRRAPLASSTARVCITPQALDRVEVGGVDQPSGVGGTGQLGHVQPGNGPRL